MIRRTDGSNWVIIDQIAHAKLAREIAAAWGGPDVAAIPEHESLSAAILHHDDGWLDWDREPLLDPGSGIPRDFREMSMPVATDIWTRSVEICAEYSIDAARWVSWHFQWLAEQARTHREAREDQLAAEQFIKAEADRFPRLSAERENENLVWLQLFDRLSLRLCCDEPPSPGPIELPGNQQLRLQFPKRDQLYFAPYPFRSGRVEFGTTGRRVPARSYNSDGEFLTELATAPTVELHWTIRRIDSTTVQ